MTPSPDADLAQALATLAQAPDPTAWALVLERAGPAMEALARRLTGDGELARDAVQEALLQIRDGAGAFRAPAEDADRAARGWILRVAANTALALRRRHLRLHRREQVVSMQNAAQPPAVDSGLAAVELADRMRSELAALPEPTRAAIVLRHCSGLAFCDVAAALGIPEGTAKVRVHRGLAVLRERLVRAGFACSLLAVGALLQQLPSCEMPVAFTGTSAALRLLTTKATSSVAFIHQGISMTTLTSISIGTAVLLIGGIGLLLGQDPPNPAPPRPVAPAPSNTAPLAATEIKPLPIAPSPAALATLKNATHTDWDGIGATWNDRLKGTEARGFTLGLWTSSELALSRPCTVPFGANWKTTLDALAKDAGEVWRMRGSAAEFMSSKLAAQLTAQLDGRSAPAGTRTQVLAWFATHAGMTFTLHESLGHDDGRLFRWAVRSATTEAWLDGMALVLGATALVSPDGAVLFYRAPALIPLDNDPEFIAKAPRLVYQAPPAARLDAEVDLDFQETSLVDVGKKIEQALFYPVAIDPAVLQANRVPLTLHANKMKLRDVASCVAELTGLKVQILKDRLLLTCEIPATTPPSEAGPVIPRTPQ